VMRISICAITRRVCHVDSRQSVGGSDNKFTRGEINSFFSKELNRSDEFATFFQLSYISLPRNGHLLNGSMLIFSRAVNYLGVFLEQ